MTFCPNLWVQQFLEILLRQVGDICSACFPFSWDSNVVKEAKKLETSKNYPLYTDKTWPKRILLGTNNAFRFLLNTNIGTENSVYIYNTYIYYTTVRALVIWLSESVSSQQNKSQSNLINVLYWIFMECEIFLRSSATSLWISAVHRWFCLLLDLIPFAVNASKTWNPWLSPNDISLLLRCLARPWLQLLPVAAPSQVSVFFVLYEGNTCSFGLRSGEGLVYYRNVMSLPWEDLGLRLTVWIGPLSFCAVRCRQIHPVTFSSRQILNKKQRRQKSNVSDT